MLPVVVLVLLALTTTTVGLTCPYESDVTNWLNSEHILCKKLVFATLLRDANAPLLSPKSRSILELEAAGDRPPVLLHLLASPTSAEECVHPLLAKKMTDSSPQSIFHLHQDVWRAKRNIVCDRLLMRLGRFRTRIFARKTSVCRIQQDVAREFLEENHLWSSTRAKHNYGLFDCNETLVAVATFSKCRTVMRNGITHKSHELLRFCTRRDGTVVGGITKLIKAFVVDQQPDDIVTVVDRDWGKGDGWHSLGFETVNTMSPLVMVVKDGARHHLVGAGIQNENKGSGGRLGLPSNVLEELSFITNAEQARECLARHGYYPVYDTGVERLMMLVPNSKAMQQRGSDCRAIDLWKTSVPTYASSYYSQNAGIAAVLKDIERMDSSSLTTHPWDSTEDAASLKS